MRKLLVLFLGFLVAMALLIPKSSGAATAPTLGQQQRLQGGSWAELNKIQYDQTVDQQLGIVSGKAGAAAGIGAESYTLSQANNTALGLARLAVGDSLSAGTSTPNRGAAGFFAASMGDIYANPPASTGQYVQYLAGSFGIPGSVKPVYAQGGIGFTSLSPILELWKIVRNFTYLLFALVFIVIGVMIMLRVKIDPKTVASIQNALPKIVIALILVTFSYAISGFLIDLMYVLIALIFTIFRSFTSIPGFDLATKLTDLQNKTIFEFARDSIWNVSIGAGSGISGIVNSLTGDIPGLSGIFGAVAGGIAALIIAIAILYALFRTWLMLLGAYIQIIIGVILSPLAMLLDAIPGQSGLSLWLRAMLTALLQFPLVVLLLLFGSALVAASGSSIVPGSENAFVPPLIGGSSLKSIPALAGLGILLLIPKASQMLQDWLKAPPFKYGTAWMEATGWAYGRSFQPWVSDIGTAVGAPTEYGRRSRLVDLMGRYVPGMGAGEPGREYMERKMGTKLGLKTQQ